MQNKYIIGSQNIGVRIETENIDIESLWNEITDNPLLLRFIPNLTLGGTADATLKVIGNSTKQASLAPHAFIRGTYKNDFSSTDVIVMAEYALERKRQEKNIYTLHSSSVSKGDKALLLIANLTGSGKTSTMLYLNNFHGYKIYSDEKVQIDGLKNLVGQVKKVFIEDKTRSLLEQNQISLGKEITIEDIGHKKLSLIVIPQINSAETVEIVQYGKGQSKWLIYEELSKDIRLVNGLVHNFTYPLMSQDTFELAQSRERLADSLAENIPVFLVKGSLKKVAEETKRLFEELA